MMAKFIERLNYIEWFASNAPMTPSPRLLEKQSYAEKVKLSYSNELKEKSEQMKVNQALRQQEVKQVTGLPYTYSTPKVEYQKQWVIKNLEVVPTYFEQLWIVTKLFTFDDWWRIRKMLETTFVKCELVWIKAQSRITLGEKEFDS